MAYVPTVPGVPAPMSYGQGYGNWQQYAGFGENKNPFGGSQGFGVQPEDKQIPNAVAPFSMQDANGTKAPEPVVPDYSFSGPLGNAPQGQLGNTPQGQLGLTMQDVIKSHFGGQ